MLEGQKALHHHQCRSAPSCSWCFLQAIWPSPGAALLLKKGVLWGDRRLLGQVGPLVGDARLFVAALVVAQKRSPDSLRRW